MRNKQKSQRLPLQKNESPQPNAGVPFVAVFRFCPSSRIRISARLLRPRSSMATGRNPFVSDFDGLSLPTPSFVGSNLPSRSPIFPHSQISASAWKLDTSSDTSDKVRKMNLQGCNRMRRDCTNRQCLLLASLGGFKFPTLLADATQTRSNRYPAIFLCG